MTVVCLVEVTDSDLLPDHVFWRHSYSLLVVESMRVVSQTSPVTTPVSPINQNIIYIHVYYICIEVIELGTVIPIRVLYLFIREVYCLLLCMLLPWKRQTMYKCLLLMPQMPPFWVPH